MRAVSLVLLVVMVGGCSCQVSRLAPEQTIDLSGRWNDADSRLVAGTMVQSLMRTERYQQYASQLGRRPAIIVGLVRNKTSEHIDAANYIKKIEVSIFDSGLADLVESDHFRDLLRRERAEQQDFASSETVKKWGREMGADLMLFGEMTSETDVSGNRRVVNYVTTLFLTEIETNKRVWFGQHEIKKFVRN